MFHIGKFLDDILFPPHCLICKRDGPLLCASCKATFPFATNSCPFCDAMTDGATCGRCSKTKKLSGAYALFDYEHPGVQKIIAGIKYRGVFSVIQNLESEIADTFFSQPALSNREAVIIPAPLRKKSFLERGFNQARLIAKTVNHTTHAPVSNTLIFLSESRAQHLLSRKERWDKMKGRVGVRHLAKGTKHAIVVDDLLTTGATLESCAQALSDAGVHTIIGFTLARQKKMFH